MTLLQPIFIKNTRRPQKTVLILLIDFRNTLYLCVKKTTHIKITLYHDNTHLVSSVTKYK